jgi:hypothetical protein
LADVVSEKKTCLIIGNGPSLADIPNEFLVKYPTFGSNRVYLKFTPDYYAFCDRLWIGHYIEDIKALTCKEKFIRAEFAHLIPGAIPLHNKPGRRMFSYEPHNWVHDGATVTFVHLQWAFHLGFERVGLIGVDHYYHGYEGEPMTQQTGKDAAHFSPDYYGDHVTYWRPNLERTTGSYEIAKKAYEKAGREIINITPGTHLDVFPKEDWQTW